MSRNPYGSELYRMTSLLSQKVSDQDGFFKAIALMNIEERLSYAILHSIIENNLLELEIEKMNEIELIEKVLMPIIQRIGQARFKADPLTHLGFKVGIEKKSRDYI